MKRISYRTILVCIILLLAIFFRFYKIHDFLIFGMDQENEILIVKNIVSGKHFPLIGLSSADTGTYRGPLFLYLSAIPYVLFNGNPLGGAITASLLGVVVSFLIYRFGSKMFSSTVGIIGALIYSASFFVAYYDRQFWNPTFIPLLSLLIGYISFEVIKQRSYLLSILLIFILGIATHAHLTILIFLPLIFWVLWSIRHKLTAKRLGLLVFILIITQLPLILFDLRHNFLNSRALISTINTIGNKSKVATTISERSQSVLSTVGKIIWVPSAADFADVSGQCRELLPFIKNQVTLGIILVIFIVGCLMLWQSGIYKDKKNSIALSITLMITLQLILFVTFYNRYILQYYLTFFFPWLSLLLAWCIAFLWQNKNIKIILMPVIILFVLFNMITLITSRYSFSYREKINALKFVSMKLGGNPYSLEAVGECPRFGGLRYLAEYEIGLPLHSYMDSYFAWLYPETIKTVPKSRIVLLSMIDARISPELIEKWEKVKFQYLMDYNIEADEKFDKIHVFILTPK